MSKKNTSKKNKSSFNFNKKPAFYMLLVLSLAVAGYFIVFSKAASNVNTTAPAAPALYATPRSQVLAKNETFTVDIRTNSGSTSVNAVQANISYPTSLVDFVSIDTNSSDYTLTAQTDTATAGVISLARGANPGSTLSGDKLVAKVTFKAKTTGGNVGINFNTGSRLLKASDSSDLLGSGDIYNATYTVDVIAPNVSVTAPSNNANVEYGSTVNITANASDNSGGSGLKNVEFLIDGIGVVQSANTSSPFLYSWNTTGKLDNATTTIQARAYDNAGNVQTSSIVSVTHKDTVKPSVSITSPSNNQNVEGTVNLTANANDSGTGVKQVEFLVDGNVISTDTTSPYSFSWDSKTVSDASHTITAKVTDKAGTANSANSTGVVVNVDNSDKVAPSAPGNLRTTDIRKDGIDLAWNASTDNVGVVTYELKRNGQVVMNANSTDFTDNGLQPSSDYTYSVVAIDAAGNRSSVSTISITTLALLPGDTNDDRVVDIVDLSRLLSAWGTQNQYNADFNADDIVDIVDLSLLLSNWTI